MIKVESKQANKEEKKIIKQIEKMGLDYKGSFGLKNGDEDLTDLDAVFYDKNNNIFLFFEIKTGSSNSGLKNQVEKINNYIYDDAEARKAIKRKLKSKDGEFLFIVISTRTCPNSIKEGHNCIDRYDWEYLLNVQKTLNELTYKYIYKFISEEINYNIDNKNINAIEFKAKVLNRSVKGYIYNTELKHIFDVTTVDRKRTRGDRSYGYQRNLKSKKIKDIANDIENNNNYFSGMAILNSQDKVKVESRNRNRSCHVKIRRPFRPLSVSIIDGQHRIYGHAKAAIKNGVNSSIWQKKFPIILFSELTLEEEIKLFVKMNANQTKIDKNLIYYLQGEECKLAKFFVKLNSGEIYSLEASIFKKTIDVGNLSPTQKKHKKYNLSSLVSMVEKNKCFYKNQEIDILKVENVIKHLNSVFSDTEENYFKKDQGMRSIFHFINIYYKNNNQRFPTKNIYKKIKNILKEDIQLLKEVEGLYGEAGASKAASIFYKKIKK